MRLCDLSVSAKVGLSSSGIAVSAGYLFGGRS